MQKWLLVLFVLLTGCIGHTFQEGQSAFSAHHYDAAFTALLPAAKNGNANAQYAIGYMYFYGKGTKRDIKEGTYWIQKAADQGQPEAVKAVHVLQESTRRPTTDPIETL